MNILHLSRQFLPCIGGAEKYIYEISKRLIKKGINCRVLTLNYDIYYKKRKFRDYQEMEGIEIFHIPGFGYYKKPIPLKVPIDLFKWADIVHTHDLRFLYETALLLKPILRYKIVFSTHGFLLHTRDFHLLKSFVIPFYYRPTIKIFIEGTICDSKQDFEYFKNWKLKNLYLIENGIDFQKFDKIQRKPQPGKFLYFGRIDKNKGLDLLFKGLALLKNENWKLDIIGSGFEDNVNELKNLAKRLKISQKIIWHGFLSEAKLLEFLAQSHLCFFPSRYEGFGFTLLEAMAAGCLCLANNIPTYGDAINNGQNGFLVDFLNYKEMAEKVKSLSKTPIENLIIITKSSKKTAKNYDWENKIDQIIKVYNNIYYIGGKK